MYSSLLLGIGLGTVKFSPTTMGMEFLRLKGDSGRGGEETGEDSASSSLMALIFELERVSDKDMH